MIRDEREFLSYDFLYKYWIMPAVKNKEDYIYRVGIVCRRFGKNMIKPSRKDYENYLEMVKILCESIVNDEFHESRQFFELASNLFKRKIIL